MSEDLAHSRRNTHDYKLLGNLINDEERCDSVELPDKLNNIAKDCNEVAEKLKKRRDTKHEKGHGSSSKQQNTRIFEFQKMADELVSENDRLSGKIDRKPEENISGKEDDGQSISSLKAGIAKLRQVCKEITAINKRWQKYNKEVQLYIRRLEDALQNKNVESVPTSQQYRDIDGKLPEGEIPLLTRYDNLLKEMCQLQKELESCKQKEEFLRDQLGQLGEESQETIKLLNCQLSIYKEDYQAEKRDKLIARSTSLKLTKELEHVRSQLREYQKRLRQVGEFSRSPSAKSPAASTNPFVFSLKEREVHSSRRNGHLRSDGSSEISEASDSSKSVSNSKEDALEKYDSYECPGCGMIFPDEKQKEYLEHFEECQRN